MREREEIMNIYDSYYCHQEDSIKSMNPPLSHVSHSNVNVRFCFKFEFKHTLTHLAQYNHLNAHQAFGENKQREREKKRVVAFLFFTCIEHRYQQFHSKHKHEYICNSNNIYKANATTSH